MTTRLVPITEEEVRHLPSWIWDKYRETQIAEAAIRQALTEQLRSIDSDPRCRDESWERVAEVCSQAVLRALHTDTT